MKWPTKKLGEVCEINPRRPRGFERADEALTTFVPMPAVAEDGGGIVAAERRPYSAVRKGYTYFADGDVLFAKITPCMQNGKHAVARGLIDGIGFGSTEFHVLRPHESVTADWIHRFLIQPRILHDGEAHFSGAVGQQRVPDGYLAALEIPLPRLSEQKRIVGKLDAQMGEVGKMRAAVEARLEAARALPSSLLRSVFNSPESQTWPTKKLGEVCGFSGGRQPPKSTFKYDPTPGYVRLIQIQDYRTDRYAVYIREEDSDRRCTEQDVMIARYGGQGDTSTIFRILRGLAGAYNVALIKSVVTDPLALDREWLYLALQRSEVRKAIVAKSARAIQSGFTKEDLQIIEIPLPSLSIQRRIVAKLDEQMARANDLIRAIESEREALAALPAALLREVFG